MSLHMAFRWRLAQEFRATSRVEPSVFTKKSRVRNASSTDYVFPAVWRFQASTVSRRQHAERNQPALGIPDCSKRKKADQTGRCRSARFPKTMTCGCGASRRTAHKSPRPKSQQLERIRGPFVNRTSDLPDCCCHMAVRNLACYKCRNGGESLGCA